MKATAVIFVLLFAIAAAVFGPLLTIWALNTLFPVLAIQYTLETWAAIVLMGMFFRANITVKGNK